MKLCFAQKVSSPLVNLKSRKKKCWQEQRADGVMARLLLIHTSWIFIPTFKTPFLFALVPVMQSHPAQHYCWQLTLPPSSSPPANALPPLFFSLVNQLYCAMHQEGLQGAFFLFFFSLFFYRSFFAVATGAEYFRACVWILSFSVHLCRYVLFGS